jgi:hypothetical protein
MEINMRNIKKLFFILAAVLVIGALIIVMRPHEKVLASNEADYIAIENTLNQYLEIEAEANFSLDDSRLVEVLANDSRGGLFGDERMNERFLKSVQWLKNNPDLQVDQIGLLDVRQAFYAFRRQAKQMYDDAIADGRLTAPNRDQIIASVDPHEYDVNTLEVDLTYSASMLLHSLPEYKAMLQAAGYDSISLPYPRPEKIIPPTFTIESIRIDNDLAHVYGTYIGSEADFIFMKRDGNWFLIGEHVKWGQGG